MRPPVKVSVEWARTLLADIDDGSGTNLEPSDVCKLHELRALAQYRIDGAVMEQALEEPKRYKAVFSTATRARTVFIRAESMAKAKEIAQVVDTVYRKAHPGHIAFEHVIVTNDLQTPKPELTLEEAILWALDKD